MGKDTDLLNLKYEIDIQNLSISASVSAAIIIGEKKIKRLVYLNSVNLKSAF
jgi:hypothetical protein